MKITNIIIKHTFSEGQVKAIAAVTIDNCITIDNIRVITTASNTFISMPSRRDSDSDTGYRDLIHPIHREARQHIESAVLKAYEDFVSSNENSFVEADENEKPLNITDIKFRQVFGSGTRLAILSVTIDNSIAIHELSILKGESGPFVSMPAKTDANGIYRELVTFSSLNARATFDKQILDIYNKYVNIAEFYAEDIEQ